MTFQYCSDLHLELAQNRDHLRQNPLVPKGETLLLAGDIVPFNELEEQAWFFDLVSSQFDAVYWVPGNHEYYYSDMGERSMLCQPVRDNVFLVNNYSLMLDDVRLVFSTLWTKISPVNQQSVQHWMPDYRLIRKNGVKFKTSDCNELHKHSREFLCQALAMGDSTKKVVVSHHIPTFLNYPEQYSASPITDAFAVEMKEFIEQTQPAYWLYGHHHENIPDFFIGNTRLITNQLGYISKGQHELFDTGKVISV